MSDDTGYPTRGDALKFFPPTLSSALLAMPADGRAELLDFIIGANNVLLAIGNNGYVIPEAATQDTVTGTAYDQDALDGVVVSLLNMIGLLDDEAAEDGASSAP